MNITKEPSGEMTALLKVEIKEEDYIEKVNKVLKDYQRKASMPGFRPGKVPFGLVKKLYGNAAKADEVNKLISENLSSYLVDNEIEILGYPIPNAEKTGVIDWGSQSDFELYFDIGLIPEFDLLFSEATSVEYYIIKASEVQVEEEIQRLADQFGTFEKVTASDERDWLDGELQQLGNDGNALEGGFSAETYIYLPSVAGEEQKARFIGLTIGDMVEFDLRTLFPENKEVSRLLKINEKQASKVSGMFRFTVKEISRMIPAEYNEDFYKKTFPDRESLDEATFRMLVRESIERNFTPESDKKFMQHAVDKLMQLHVFDLPEEFLKRWMVANNKGKISPEEAEKDLPGLARSLKWDLVKHKIAKAHNIKVTEDDLRNYVKSYFIKRFNSPVDDEDNQQMEQYVDHVLSKEEDAERIEAGIFNYRITTLMKQQLTLIEKEVTVEEFIAIMGATHSHDHSHDYHHHHDHDHHGCRHH